MHSIVYNSMYHNIYYFTVLSILYLHIFYERRHSENYNNAL